MTKEDFLKTEQIQCEINDCIKLKNILSALINNTMLCNDKVKCDLNTMICNYFNTHIPNLEGELDK